MAKRGNTFEMDCSCPARVRAKRTPPRKVDGLINARLLAFEHPDTFFVPRDSELKKVKPGDHVKVSRGGERFWVKVEGFEGRKWHGMIDNVLKRNYDLRAGDRIYFQRKHIYAVTRYR